MPAIRSVIARLDPRLPVASARTLDEVVDTNLALYRFISMLMGAFASLAVALMTGGLYGVISYVAAQRTHEIGVRVDIGRLVTTTGFVLCLCGAALGAAGGYSLGRSASTMLYEIQPADPSTSAALAVAVLAIAAAARRVPAKRARRVDPAAVLRNE